MAADTQYEGKAVRMGRRHKSETVALTDSILTTPEIDWSWVADAVAVITGNPTTLTFHAAEGPGGTYKALYDNAGNAVTLAVTQNRTYQLPAALFGCGAIKIVGGAAGNILLSKKG